MGVEMPVSVEPSQMRPGPDTGCGDQATNTNRVVTSSVSNEVNVQLPSLRRASTVRRNCRFPEPNYYRRPTGDIAAIAELQDEVSSVRLSDIPVDPARHIVGIAAAPC
jgi:hypothetical protein